MMRIGAFVLMLVASYASANANGISRERPRNQSTAELRCDAKPYTLSSGETCRVVCPPSTAVRVRGLWTAKIIDIRSNPCDPRQRDRCDVVDELEFAGSRQLICVKAGYMVCVETLEDGEPRHHNWFYATRPRWARR